jgi:hypothetical protein
MFHLKIGRAQTLWPGLQPETVAYRVVTGWLL